MHPAENTAGVCSSSGIAPTTSMPATCFSSLICWMARSASPVTRRSAVKPDGVIVACALIGGDPHALDQAREENAAGPQPRISHRAGTEQSGPQRSFSCDNGMRKASSDRDANKRAGEIDAALRNHPPLARKFVKPLAGQDDDVGMFAAAQAIEQRKRRRKLGIDPRCRQRLVLVGKPMHRAFQGQGREHANGVGHRRSTPAQKSGTGLGRAFPNMRVPGIANAPAI
jgi:hypothetical protein